MKLLKSYIIWILYCLFWWCKHKFVGHVMVHVSLWASYNASSIIMLLQIYISFLTSSIPISSHASQQWPIVAWCFKRLSFLHIETETRWPTFCRRHFQVHFLEWIYFNWDWFFPDFFSKSQIDNIPALVQMMPWRRSGDKPTSEPMMVCLLTHIFVTQPQWVK